MTADRILVADDHPDVLEALRIVLKSEGFVTKAARSPAEVLEAVLCGDVDLVLMDLNYARDTTSGAEGFELLERLRVVDPTLPVVVMTAWATIEGAVAAVQRGARDYVAKPWDTPRLVATMRTQIEVARANRKARRLELEMSRERAKQLPLLIADAPSMRPVLRVIEQVAPSSANLLILGEHGTGKDVIARWVHERSPRVARPFVTVDAGSIAPGVFESELFGHARGAFTDAKTDSMGCFELADSGTLFLDEVGNVPISHQSKLLRVIQSGEFSPVGSARTRRVDVRLVAATNTDLRRAVADGRFREDLLYRLNTVEVHLPPLRERREDILTLAQHFLRRSATRYGKEIGGFAPSASAALVEHAWPGNIRELEHAVERAVLMASCDTIAVDDLGLRGGGPRSLDEMPLEEAERHLIERALVRASGKVSVAAAALKMSRSALYRRLEYHGIKTS